MEDFVLDDTGKALLLLALVLAAGALCSLLAVGGLVALAVLLALAVVGFVIGFLTP